MPVQTKIQHRRDTATNWSNTNPTLSAGEIGVDTTNKRIKVGDGSTAWNSLAFQTRNIFIQSSGTTPTGAVEGDIWIQI